MIFGVIAVSTVLTTGIENVVRVGWIWVKAMQWTRVVILYAMEISWNGRMCWIGVVSLNSNDYRGRNQISWTILALHVHGFLGLRRGVQLPHLLYQ